MTKIEFYGGSLNGQHRDLLPGRKLPNLGDGNEYEEHTEGGVTFACPKGWNFGRQTLSLDVKDPGEADVKMDQFIQGEPGWIEVAGTRQHDSGHREKSGNGALTTGSRRTVSAVVVAPPPPKQ